MKIDSVQFPILNFIDNNYLNPDIIEDLLYDSGYGDEAIESIGESFNLFLDVKLKIDLVSKEILNKLLKPSDYLKAKILLSNSDEIRGLLLLPETIYPNFDNVPKDEDVKAEDYPINGIFYSWLSPANYEKFSGENWGYSGFNKEENYSRLLNIIPIHNDKVTQAASVAVMESGNSDFSEEYRGDLIYTEDRSWYGNIFDYIMAFILHQEIELDMKSKVQIDENKNYINHLF